MATQKHISLLSPAVGTQNVGDDFIEMAIRRLLDQETSFRRFTIRRALKAQEIDEINETSCALICGTNLYQHDWESALDVATLKKIRVPVIPFGVGSSASQMSDTYIGDQTRTMIRALHERCAAGSVRDPHGAAVLERAGVENFIMTGCPVLFWAGQENLPAVSIGPRKRLVLTARNWLMHRWPDNVDHPVQVDLLRRVLSHFAGEQILFAVHEDFDRSLVEKLGVSASAVVDASEPEAYVQLYSDPQNAVLAMRLHAGMLARANGLGAVFVGHDTRTYAFCEMMGIECIDLFDSQCVKKTLAALDWVMAGEACEDGCETVFSGLMESMTRFMEANDLPARARLALR
jgi:hypothetical protein